MIDLMRYRTPLTGQQLVRILTEDWTPPTEAVGATVDLEPAMTQMSELTRDRGDLLPETDAVLSPALHTAMLNVGQRNLLDMRVWHWMTTVPLRSYTLKRWSGGPLPDLEAGVPKGLQLRFLGSPSMVGFSRNAAARLYWVADALREGGSYELTRKAFAHQDLIAGLFERRMSLVPAVARACVRHLADLKEDERRAALTRLNFRASTLELEVIDEEAAASLLHG